MFTVSNDHCRYLVGEKELCVEEAIEESVHKIDQIPNHYPYQLAVPFVTPLLPGFIPPPMSMASGIHDRSLITPPDTPSSQTSNLSELFGAPRRCSSREHKQTNFFAATDSELENPRKRRRNVIGGPARIASRRMLKFNETEELIESKNSSDLIPVPVVYLDSTPVCMHTCTCTHCLVETTTELYYIHIRHTMRVYTTNPQIC